MKTCTNIYMARFSGKVDSSNDYLTVTFIPGYCEWKTVHRNKNILHENKTISVKYISKS